MVTQELTHDGYPERRSASEQRRPLMRGKYVAIETSSWSQKKLTVEIVTLGLGILSSDKIVKNPFLYCKYKLETRDDASNYGAAELSAPSTLENFCV
jgi:hypothetical protein